MASFVSHNLELKDTAKKEARMKSCHDICGSFPLLDQIHMLERLVQISTVDLEDDDSAMEDEDEEVRDIFVIHVGGTRCVPFSTTR